MDNIIAFSQRFCSLFKEQNYKSISAFLREYKERYPYESFTHKVFLQYQNAEATPSIDRLHNLCNMWNVSSDYLLGLSEKKEYKDVQYISETIGLSEDAIATLRYFNKDAKAIMYEINRILSSDFREDFIICLADYFKFRDVFEIQTEIGNEVMWISSEDIKARKFTDLKACIDDIDEELNHTKERFEHEILSISELRKVIRKNGGNKKKKE